jgi:hypothetical protein
VGGSNCCLYFYGKCLAWFKPTVVSSCIIQSGIGHTFRSGFSDKIVCVGRCDYAGQKFLSSASPPTPETRDDLFNWGNRGLRTVFPYQGVGHTLTDGPGTNGTIHRLASLLTAVIRYWCGTCRGPVFPLFYFWFFHTDRYASVLLLTVAISRASRYIYSVSACGISCQIHHERQEDGIYKIV